MNELLKIVLSLSLSGTLLFFILLAFKPLYRHRFSKGWQYYIWMIVIARMLLPFTPETTLVGWVFQHIENSNGGDILMASPMEETFSDFPLGDGDMPAVAQGETPKATTSSFSMQGGLLKIYENLWMLWAATAFALLIRKITLYQSFLRFIKAGRTEVADISILNTLAEVGERIGVKRPVELFTNPLISSPMLLGFFRPCIILPNIKLEKAELSYILRHELIHYKRLDMFYKWLVQLTVCLHWFNPFSYLMAKEINKYCELSCDEAMIQAMDTLEKKAYGDTLINARKAMGNYNDKLATVTLTESGELLKERLDAIMKFKKTSKVTVAAMLAFALVFTGGATAIGAAAPANQPSAYPRSVVGNSSGKSYLYSQESYYQEPYFFEIGRNLNEAEYLAYPNKAVITLSDKTAITVSFDTSCKEYARDKDALAALKILLDKLKTEYRNSMLPIEHPLVSSVDYVGDQDLSQLAEEYYTTNALTKFVAIFPTLEVGIQKMYCDKMYTDGKIAFFAATLNKMDTHMIDVYVEKSYTDRKVNFFSTIVPFLSDEAKNQWIVKSSQDGRSNFLAILTQPVPKAESMQRSGLLAENAKEIALSLVVDNGGVAILPSATNEITASYDNQYYDVTPCP